MTNRPFVIGESYRDHRGTYRVIAVEENRLVYDYGDGIQQTGDAETKWRIHRNMLLAERLPYRAAPPSQRSRSSSGEEFWSYEEVAAIFAEAIRAYAENHKDFMRHEKIVTAFMAHPEGRRILERRQDERPNEYWVGVMKAHFSRKYNSGRSEWGDSFEPKIISGAYAYRVRRKKTSPLK